MMTPSLVRQYSLCGDTANRAEWRVGVLLDPNSRGGSQFVHDKLHEGTTVRVRGPRNHFPLVSSPRYQFIAGGIGITPMLPMIAAAEATGADWRLLYGGRTRSSMAFVDDVGALRRPRHRLPPRCAGRHELPDEPRLGAVRRRRRTRWCTAADPKGCCSAVEEACSPGPTAACTSNDSRPKSSRTVVTRRAGVV